MKILIALMTRMAVVLFTMKMVIEDDGVEDDADGVDDHDADDDETTGA
jgi:hypothetical protein